MMANQSIPPVTNLALMEFSKLQLCGSASLLQSILASFESHLRISKQQTGTIRLAGPGHMDYVAALDALMRFAQEKMENILVTIPSCASDGSMSLIETQFGLGLRTLFSAFSDANEHWVALKECSHRVWLAQASGKAISVGAASPCFFLLPAGSSRRGRGPLYKLKKASHPLQASSPARAASTASTGAPDAATNSSSGATCELGHAIQPLVDTWTPSSAQPEQLACVACYDAIVERCINGPDSKVQYDQAWWDLFMIAESLTKAPLSYKRKAALQSLRAFPWLSREWVEVQRAATGLMGVEDPRCPVFALCVAKLTAQRMSLVGTSDVAVVLDRMRDGGCVTGNGFGARP